MKRKTYWLLVAFLVGLVVLLSWSAFYPAIPNTPTAKRGFQEMTGFDPSGVSGIYYFQLGAGIRGGDAEYLRFIYPDEHWLQRFLDRLALVRLTNSGGGLYTDSIPTWWDYSTIWSLAECYGRSSEHRPNHTVLWLDRERQYIYLYEGML
jgi:hypothetical protein